MELPGDRNNYLLNLYRLRLIISIVGGFIPLITGDLFWEMGLLSPISIIMVILIIALILSRLFLKFEIRKVLGIKKNYNIKKRILNVFTRAVNYSIYIGLILLDILCIQYLLQYKDLQTNFPLKIIYWFFSRIIGALDMQLLFSFASTAIFLLIVVHFIWEEKPITHPIK